MSQRVGEGQRLTYSLSKSRLKAVSHPEKIEKNQAKTPKLLFLILNFRPFCSQDSGKFEFLNFEA